MSVPAIISLKPRLPMPNGLSVFWFSWDLPIIFLVTQESSWLMPMDSPGLLSRRVTFLGVPKKEVGERSIALGPVA